MTAPATSSFVSPLVRHLARQNGLRLDGLTGAGARGRIRKEDVQRLIASQAGASNTPRDGKRLEGPATQLTSVIEVDVSAVVRFIEEQQEPFQERTGLTLTFLPFLARAAVVALSDHPALNAHIGETIRSFPPEINLTVAVGGGQAAVSVIPAATNLSVEGLARAIGRRAERVRRADAPRGTFTLTSSGDESILFNTPLVAAGQSAALAAGSVVARPVVRTIADGSQVISIRSMTHLAVSYDHRVVGVGDAAAYLSAVRHQLESISRTDVPSPS